MFPLFQGHTCKLAKLSSSCIVRSMATINNINFTFFALYSKMHQYLVTASMHKSFKDVSVYIHVHAECVHVQFFKLIFTKKQRGV